MINTRFRRANINNEVCLYTPLSITKRGIDARLHMYDVSKKNANEISLEAYGSVDVDRFFGTIISAKPITLGEKMSISESIYPNTPYGGQYLDHYVRDRLDPIKLYVVQSTHRADMNTILKKREALRICLSSLLHRDVNDITLVDDNITIDTDDCTKIKSVERLGNSLKLMCEEATHIIVLDSDDPDSKIKKCFCEAYNLNDIPVRSVVWSCKDNPDLKEYYDILSGYMKIHDTLDAISGEYDPFDDIKRSM